MILIDNTVLSNFALINRPEFIKCAFVEDIGTTKQVLNELDRGVELGRIPVCNWTWLHHLQLTSKEESQFQQLIKRLDEGEASCLAAAIHRNYKIATDDKDARHWAMHFTIPYTGTLGILANLVKQRDITLIEGNSLLQQMIKKGYHSPITTLDDLLT